MDKKTSNATIGAALSNLPISFWVLLLLSAVFRFYIVQLDLNILLNTGLLQDDAFYYYEIAHQFSTNGTISFDGINNTNGFHPLWQGISLLVFDLWQGELPLRIMLSIACVLDLLAIMLLFFLVLNITGQASYGLIAMAIWGLHGTLIRTWFNGLETALMIFTILLFLLYYQKIRNTNIFELKQHLILGCLAALAFLARTDSAVIIFVLFVFLYLFPVLKNPLSPDCYYPGVSASVACLLIISPWLFWNYQQFGSLVQVSGQIKHGVWLTGWSVPQFGWWESLQYGLFKSLVFIGVVFRKMFQPAYKIPISDYIYLVVFVVINTVAWYRSSNYRKYFLQLAPFLFGALFLFIYHAGVRHFVRGWYNAPLLLVSTILSCFLLGEFLSRLKGRSLYLWGCFSLLAIILTLYSPYFYTKSLRQIKTDPRIAAANWLNKHIQKDIHVGAANAGIVGYFADNPVINLDGVVNESALHARMDNAIHYYVYKTGIRYFADHQGTIEHLCLDNQYYTCKELVVFRQKTKIVEVIPFSNP